MTFDEHVMALLRHAPTARRWLVGDTELQADGLSELVPGWPELNDALFWYSARATRTERGRDRLGLNDVWPLQRLEHYWAFGPDSFERIVGYVRTRELEDDRVIALSLAFGIYREANEPAEWWDELQACVRNDRTLSAALDNRVNPHVPEDVAKSEREWAEYQEKLEHEEREAAENRARWIAHLKANPDIVRSPRGLHPGQFSTDQYWLLREVEGDDVREERAQGSEWRTLIDEFGEDVARAYQDAAVEHWRHFRPELRSEGGNTSSIPYSLLFAMAGLAIEADEVEGFPGQFDASEVRLALRYIVFELNGFPRWLESMYRAWPDEVLDAVLTELLWELESTDPDEPMHYILHDLAVYSPWLHGALAGPLLCWIRSHDLPSDAALDYSFRILRCGELAPSDLVSRHTCYVVLSLVTFSSSHDGEEVGMKRYVVALEKEERDELAGITRKGSHQSQKVVNALILLNCDEGEFNEHRARGEAIAEILRISARKVDRVKKRFVEEGMEAALGGRQGRRPSYVRKADGEFEARLVALSCAEPPQGHSQWSLRLLADRVVELGHIDSVSHETVRRVLKKTQSSRGGASAG